MYGSVDFRGRSEEARVMWMSRRWIRKKTNMMVALRRSAGKCKIYSDHITCRYEYWKVIVEMFSSMRNISDSFSPRGPH